MSPPQVSGISPPIVEPIKIPIQMDDPMLSSVIRKDDSVGHAQAGNCQISKSGSGGWKGARIDLLVGLTAVQFDKIDQHQPVRRLTIFPRLSKQGALVW
jgi:hypothetical protein